MTVNIRIFDFCGTFCSSGEQAMSIRVAHIDPFVEDADEIHLDFGGVRNMSSSFCNVLIGNLIANVGADVVPKLRFLNCNETVQVHIRSALSIGLSAAVTNPSAFSL